MPRLRLPRINIASLRSRVSSEERLMSLALVAGFVVVIGVVAAFVLIASANVGEGVAVKVPAIPTITDTSQPETTTTREAERPERPLLPATGISTTQAEVVKVPPKPRPTPKPQPPKPVPAPPPQPAPTVQPPDPGPGPGPGPVEADPYDHCAPEGAQAVTRHRHIPLVCRDGRWHFVGIAR
jgi:outer membrane biosynthesis protein TonB